MSPTLTKVRYLDEYRLELSFTDGQVRVLDFRDEILNRQGVWTPLRDRAFFRQAYIEPEFGTLAWPNGVDYCPDVLYSLALGRPVAPIGKKKKALAKPA